ncbi:hypothetical protein [uncultured Chitinophaga sp.]|uniref:hypothetical protein n=1 Tax=uncultured Chitinophaga sp. TaxID=339340 RepID=UPI0025E8AEAD|nr:hypothetical protein [uncultured Chitinophaga sp.]
MKKKLTIATVLLIVFAATFQACKKDDYKNDGGLHNAKVDMTTYDYLKSKKGIFDSLVYLIDRAGLKEMVNSDITFFAATNYAVVDFMKAKKIIRDQIYNDENMPYSMDSIPLQVLKDSLLTYMFPGKINRDQMTVAGKVLDSKLGAIPNTKFIIRLSRREDYGAYLKYVDYVQLGKIIGTRDDEQADPDNVPPEEKDIIEDCQTSGIITNTGIIHVMFGNHHLFFNSERTSN